MKLFKRGSPPPGRLSRDEALDCIPVKSDGIQESRTPEGVVRLGYPLAVKPWLADLARRFGGGRETPPARQLELDRLGSLTWELIDGRRTVRTIVQGFTRQTRVHPKEAEAAVTRFLRELGRRGIIGMAPPAAARPEGE